MPSQKRSAPTIPDAEEGAGGEPRPRSPSPKREKVVEEEEEEEEEVVVETKEAEEEDAPPRADLEGDGGSPASSTAKEEFIQVNLAEIRKEVQCPICLGIIRKTRTVMECLHRFCRECIDKSMRLGNNECPSCRTHCASRRSLRDDPNYDALIAALYPDIDKFEEEELAFREEEDNRNKQIQAAIAETLRRQTEALVRRRPTSRTTAAAFMRKSGNLRRGRSRNSVRDTGLQVSDDEDEDVNGNDGGKDSSSTDEPCPDVRPKRCRRWPGPRRSPGLAATSTTDGDDEGDDVGGRDFRIAPLGRAANREVLVWGKGGVRSQTRHGSGSGANGKNGKGGRVTKLVDYLRSLSENENEFYFHLTLIPLDKENVPSLEQPHLCCRPTLSVNQICQFIALQTSRPAEEIEILVKKPHTSTTDNTSSKGDHIPKSEDNASEDDLHILGAQESLSGMHASFPSNSGNLVLIYRTKN